MISDDKENSSNDDRGKLKTVKRKVKHLFGKADKEEENQAADFVEDDAQGELRMCRYREVPDCNRQDVGCISNATLADRFRHHEREREVPLWQD